MASKQRKRAPKKERTSNLLPGLGNFDIPDLDIMDDDNESDIDESVLESELEAILSGKAVSKPPRPKKKVAGPVDIETMAAKCMEEIDVEDDDDDDNLLNDPDLLKELQGLSSQSPEEESVENLTHFVEKTKIAKEVPPSHTERTAPGSIVAILEERLKLYNDAISVAKELNESSKVRRYSRALKTLEQLIKSAKSGKNINEEDIPPVVSVPKAKVSVPKPPPKSDFEPKEQTLPSSAASGNVPTGNLIDIPGFVSHEPTETQKIEIINPNIATLVAKRDECKIAALKAKRAGDKATALGYMKTLKNLEAMIEAAKNGEEIDLSNLPPFPSVATSMSESTLPRKELDETQTSSSIEAAALSAASEPEDPTLFGAPPAPTSVLEALYQRLEKFKVSKESAEAEGNSSKVRRLDRILKSYEKAIRDHKAGKPVCYDDLPIPPGFAPIPVPEESGKSKLTDTSIASGDGKENKGVPPKRPAPEVPAKKPLPEVPPKRTAPEVPQKSKVQRGNSTVVEKQLQFLLERQKMFRQAAIASKKSGDIEQAKNYLKLMKGFDNMIEATRCGLPVDISSIPTPPQLESDFVIVDVEDCVEGDGTSAELLETLENDLTKQIEVCHQNKDHFLKLGDVSSASKFEKLGLESRKDLSVIRHLKKTGQAAPKFHYETRLFSIVQCNTHLSDSEVEVIVERGINFPGKPDDLDSYVKVDFPIPSDSPQKAKTHTVRDTNNPIFQEEFKFEINRQSRAQLRQFKRGALKLEVWSKGGFLRSDSLLGTVSVKLVDLESKCSIHDSFDLMEGRKSVGGKLEVKIKIRNPLFTKQVEEVREKWLVIGS